VASSTLTVSDAGMLPKPTARFFGYLTMIVILALA